MGVPTRSSWWALPYINRPRPAAETLRDSARKANEPTCTPGSVTADRRRRRWRPSILARRRRRAHATYPQARASSPQAPAVRSCSGRGLPSHRSHLRCWWALTPPFHPYQPVPRQAVYSLWHCPAGRPGWPLATALLCGARTFLDLPVPQEYRGRPVGSSAQCTLSSPEPARLLSGASCGSGNNYECDSVRRVHRAHRGRRARRISPPCAQE